MVAEALRTSPELNRAMTEAIRSGDLVSIRLLPTGEAERNGEYDPYYREIRLRSDLLNVTPREENVHQVVDVLAHETSHAQRRQGLNSFRDRMLQRAHAIAGIEGSRDWTGFVRDYIVFGRREEAHAELDGINAVADHMRAVDGTPVTEAKLARRLHATSACVERHGRQFRFSPRITFDPTTQSVRTTPANLEAIARCHFDGNPDYRHHYAAAAITLIADRELAYRSEEPHRRRMDNRIALSELGLDPHRLAGMSLRLAAKESFQIVDVSGGSSRIIEFRGSAPRPAQKLHEVRPRVAAESAPRTPADPHHPDHALWVKLQDRVRELDRAAGKGWDEHSERLLASALVMAKANGFGADDELRLAFNLPTDRYAAGEIVHLWRDRPTASRDPAANRAHMSTREALAMPAEERYRQLEASADVRVRTRNEPQPHWTITSDAPASLACHKPVAASGDVRSRWKPRVLVKRDQ
ncbi:MAG: XVIPCD domain-containing protein [Pseudomonadota bacterium]